MNNLINIEMSKENVDNLKSLLLEKIRFIDDQIKKYSNIISYYICNHDYNYEGCTYQQAINCGERLGKEINKYIDILDAINKYVQD